MSAHQLKTVAAPRAAKPSAHAPGARTLLLGLDLDLPGGLLPGLQDDRDRADAVAVAGGDVVLDGVVRSDRLLLNGPYPNSEWRLPSGVPCRSACMASRRLSTLVRPHEMLDHAAVDKTERLGSRFLAGRTRLFRRGSAAGTCWPVT